MAGIVGDPGAADDRTQHRRERDQQHPAAGVDGHRRGHRHRRCARCSRRPKDPKNPDAIAPGAIVLLSDGTNTAGRAPLQAAAEAKAAKVPVYTIAYGTENGYVDLDGKREPVPVDHEVMQQIAEATGGDYFAAATRRSAEDGVPEHRLRGRLREGRPRGDRPLRRLRPGLGRARRARRHLPGSEVAVMIVPLLSFLAPVRGSGCCCSSRLLVGLYLLAGAAQAQSQPAASGGPCSTW